MNSRSAIAVAGLLALFSSPAPLEAWPTDSHANLPLCISSNAQASPGIAADGAGGVFATFIDARTGSQPRIYAQHVLSDGSIDPAWPLDCRKASEGSSQQAQSCAVSDGVGGVIVGWQDLAAGNGDIRAQHLTASGAIDPLWPPDGVPVCTDPGAQSLPGIFSDGHGGALLAWQDSRAGTPERYVQHVRSDGSLDPVWPIDGRRVSPQATGATSVSIVPDAGGGAISVWRAGAVHGAHVLANGSLDPAWPESGVIVSARADSLADPTVVPDGAGGALVSWPDLHGPGPVLRAQHVLASGTLDAAWPAGGVVAGPGQSLITVPDGSGGVLIVRLYGALLAQHVLASGLVDPAWPAAGLSVCPAAVGVHAMAATGDDAGDLLLVWDDHRNDATYTDLYGQRIRADGLIDPAWPAAGLPVCRAANDQTSPVLVGDGAGGFIAGWNDYRDLETVPKVYLQRVLASGKLGPSDEDHLIPGVPVSTVASSQAGPRLVTDGAGGALVVWRDSRGAGESVYIQHVLAGSIIDPAWPSGGLPVCGVPFRQRYPGIASDGQGGAIVAWQDYRTDATAPDVYVQHVLGSGLLDPLWPDSGLVVCAIDWQQGRPELAGDGAGGAIVVWQDFRNLARGGCDLYAQHVLAGGSIDPSWPSSGLLVNLPDTRFAASNLDYQAMQIVTDGAGGAIVTWTTDPNLGVIYSARITNAGSMPPSWPTGGYQPRAGYGPTPVATSDGLGGEYIGAIYSDDGYLQHVLASGSIQWGQSALTVSGNGLCRPPPALAADAVGGAYLGWWDARTSPPSVFVQHVTSTSLDPAWKISGNQLCPSDGLQLNPAMVADGRGGAIVVWSDSRGGTASGYDLYAAHMLITGKRDPLWPAGARILCNAPGDQGFTATPAIVSDGAGGGILAWEDPRGICVQNVRANGELGWDYPVPTRASLVSVEVGSFGVRLSWESRLAAGSRVTVERRTPSSGWLRLGSVTADRAGLVRHADGQVMPGSRYGYRFVPEAGIPSSEAWVDIPAGPGLRIESVGPNPASGEVFVSFVSPNGAPLSIECVDVAGRRVGGHIEIAAARGSQRVRVSLGSRPAAGVYVLRVEQAGTRCSRKFCVVH